MRIAVSGRRDLAPADYLLIERRIAQILSEHPEELLFGGARGADTVALAAAGRARAGPQPPKLTVIVPGRVKDQPLQAQKWISACADQVVELNAPLLDARAYQERNQALVDRSDRLEAFWDGCSRGTGMTIRLAEDAGKPVHVVYLSGNAAGKSPPPA